MAQTQASPPPHPTSYPLEKIRIVLFEGIHDRAAELLDATGFTVERIDGSASGDELTEIAGDAHIVGIRSKTQLTSEFLENAPRLWAVGCFCIGTNQVDLDAASERGVAVFNAPFSNTRSVAEMTMAEIIALHRGMFMRSMQMHNGRWNKSASGSHEVRGRTLGIIGYGRIGSQISVIAESLGMNVVFYDTANVLPLGNARGLGSMESVLETADVVTIHVPATERTRGMIGAEQIARMKKGAHLINNARGDVVDVDALAEALKSGHLDGAALDVFPSEPSTNSEPFDSPLRGVENVILTPHIGGSTMEAQQNIADEVAGKLIRYMNNGSTATSVNMPEADLPSLHDDHHRILHYHRNVPGVLSKLHQAIAELGVNVAAEHLQSNPKYSYVIMDVDSSQGEQLAERLRGIEETIRLRTLW